jgi:hypothetical protein
VLQRPPDCLRIAVERRGDDDQPLNAAISDRREAITYLVCGPGDGEPVDELVIQLLGGPGTGLAVVRLLIAGGGLGDPMPG